MGQAKRKLDNLPPGCIAPASYGTARWHFALTLTGRSGADTLAAEAIEFAADSFRLVPGTFNDADPCAELPFGARSRIDLRAGKAGQTLLLGSDLEVIRVLDGPEREITQDGTRMRPCTVDGLPAYAGEASDVRQAVYEHIGAILRKPDGSALTDPTELCRGRLRWHERPTRLYRADAPLAYQEQAIDYARGRGAGAEEAEHAYNHAVGFSRACELFPTPETRTIGAHTDRCILRALSGHDLGLRKDVDDLRRLAARLYGYRAGGRMHEIVMAATTLADGEAWSLESRPSKAFDAIASILAGLSRKAGEGDPAGACAVQLYNGTGEGTYASPQLRPARRLAASLPAIAEAAETDWSATLHTMKGTGRIAVIEQGPTTTIGYWDEP